MLKITEDFQIPFYLTEIKYSNYLDFTAVEVDDTNKYRDVEVLTGVDFSKNFGKFSKVNVANSLRRRVQSYTPAKIDSFIHNENLYLIKEHKDITITEGLLALNFAKEFTKQKYEKLQGLYAMKLYLIATMTRKVINGQVEELPCNLGEIHDFVEERVKELEDISFKNAIDFEFFFYEFEQKLSDSYFQYAFKSIHPVNVKHIDRESTDRGQRYNTTFGAFAILEHLLKNNLIDAGEQGLKTPFFHCIFLYALSSNR